MGTDSVNVMPLLNAIPQGCGIAQLIQRLGHGLDDQHSIFGADRDFPFRLNLGPTQPSNQQATEAISPAEKWPGHLQFYAFLYEVCETNAFIRRQKNRLQLPANSVP